MPKGIAGGGAGGGSGADAANASASGGAGAAGKGSGNKGKKGKGPKKASQKKKENCKPKSVSQKKYDKLRDKTPSKKIQKAMKKSKNCYACGGALVPSVFADHTVPMKQITQMKGFSCLKEKDQVSVLNDPKNFKALCGRCNSSKGAKKWNEWKGHPELPIRPGAKGAAVQDAAKMEKALASAIGDKLG